MGDITCLTISHFFSYNENRLHSLKKIFPFHVAWIYPSVEQLVESASLQIQNTNLPDSQYTNPPQTSPQMSIPCYNIRTMEEKQKIKSETFWQITFPLILGSLIIAALATWAVITAVNGNDIRKQADVSAIFLLAPFLLCTLIPLALTAITAYGIIRLNKILPKYTRQGQEFVSQVEEKVKILADKITEPFLRLESLWASLRALFRR